MAAVLNRQPAHIFGLPNVTDGELHTPAEQWTMVQLHGEDVFAIEMGSFSSFLFTPFDS